MKHFNFILILITVALLGIIGVIFIIGTIYGSVQEPNWTETLLYQQYLDNMNLGVIPFVIALLAVLGLCIPKRLFSGKDLLIINGALVAITLILALALGTKFGLGFLLAVGGLIQVVVIVLTSFGSKRVRFEKTGFFLQMGSAIIHLGFVIFLFDFMILADDPNHLTVFWIATAFMTVGMIFSFYSREISKALQRRNRQQLEEI